MLSRLATHGTGNPCRELVDRPGNERDYNRANILENCVAGEDHDRSATDWLGQFSLPDIPTLHASSGFQSETSGSSPSSAACASATWVGLGREAQGFPRPVSTRHSFPVKYFTGKTPYRYYLEGK